MTTLLRHMNWRRHGPGLTVLGLALCCFVFSLAYRVGARDALLETQRRVQAQSAINRDAQRAEQVLERALPLYLDDKARGVIGAPARLDWIETLRDIGERHAIPNIQFSLEQTRDVGEYDDIHWRGDITVQSTPMRLTLTLLHEGDFYRLLNELHRRAPGLFSVEACRLTREISRLPPGTGAFKGVCELRWYSIADITQSWEAPL